MGVSLQGGVGMMSILQLLYHVVSELVPRLEPEVRFLKATEESMNVCLSKDPEATETPKELPVSTFSGLQ